MSAQNPMLPRPPTRKAIYMGRAKTAAKAIACAAAAKACANLDGFMLSLLDGPSPFAFLIPYMTIILLFASCGFVFFVWSFLKLAYKALPPLPVDPFQAERAVELAIQHPELEAYRGQVASMGRSFNTDDLSGFLAFDQSVQTRRAIEAADAAKALEEENRKAALDAAAAAKALAEDKRKAATAALRSTTPLPGTLQAQSERAIGLASQANAATRAELSNLSSPDESIASAQG